MKRIDNMMDEYKISDNRNTNDFADNYYMTDEEKNRILAATLRKAGLPERKKEAGKNGFSRKRIISLALVTTLCFGTICVFATGNFRISDTLKGYFGIESEEEAGQLAKSGKVIGVTAENNGWKLNVKEVVGDSKSVSVLYDVTAPAGTVLGDNEYMFRNQRVVIDTLAGYSAGWSSDELKDENLTDNTKSFVLNMDSSKDLKCKDLTLTFGDFAMYSIAIGDFEMLAEGDMTVTFPLNYEVNSKVVKVGEEVQIFDGISTLKDVEISPLSAIINIEGDSIEKYDEQPPNPETVQGSEIGFEIMMKDGKVFKDADSTSTSIRNGVYTVIVSYSRLIDVDEIKSVKVCGKTIKI